MDTRLSPLEEEDSTSQGIKTNSRESEPLCAAVSSHPSQRNRNQRSFRMEEDENSSKRDIGHKESATLMKESRIALPSSVRLHK